mmetsp:Transcript_30864/g.71709  ORF Transcript_30864/g.71709 Transcript_30864/m.71709 type:complete len:264 (-) Transcript_30864:392-1183(-)
MSSQRVADESHRPSVDKMLHHSPLCLPIVVARLATKIARLVARALPIVTTSGSRHACRERRRGRLVSEAVEGHGLAHGEREHHAQQARRDHPNVPATMGMLQLCRLPDEHRIHHQPRQWAACAHPHSCRRGGSSETDRREDALPEPLVERAVEQLVRRVGAHERVPTPRLPVEKAEGAPRTNCLEPLAPGRRQIEPDDRVVRIDLPPMVGIPEGATRADDRARAVGHPRPALSAVDHASAILKEASSQRDTPAFGQCLMVDSP